MFSEILPIFHYLSNIFALLEHHSLSQNTHFIGTLKAKLARLRNELFVEQSGGGSGGPSEGFDVARNGDARVALIGFPSVGKSTLLSKLTETESLSAAYEFTTLTCIPGVLKVRTVVWEHERKK